MASSDKLHIVKPHPDAIAGLRQRASGGARLAPGFEADKALNLNCRGGRTLAELRFANFFLEADWLLHPLLRRNVRCTVNQKHCLQWARMRSLQCRPRTEIVPRRSSDLERRGS